MKSRRTDSPSAAAAKSSFNTATAYRVASDRDRRRRSVAHSRAGSLIR